MTTPPAFRRLLEALHTNALAAGVFASANIVTSARRGSAGDMLRCPALASAEPAEFRVFIDEGKVWIALITEARWLSQSIEADLVHTGDKIEDLLEEELIDQGWEGVRLSYQHFRDEDKLFTFRSPLPFALAACDTPEAIDKSARALLAYEAAFRPLGDMEADDEE
jgi:hypothetical protein